MTPKQSAVSIQCFMTAMSRETINPSRLETFSIRSKFLVTLTEVFSSVWILAWVVSWPLLNEIVELLNCSFQTKAPRFQLSCLISFLCHFSNRLPSSLCSTLFKSHKEVLPGLSIVFVMLLQTPGSFHAALFMLLSAFTTASSPLITLTSCFQTHCYCIQRNLDVVLWIKLLNIWLLL